MEHRILIVCFVHQIVVNEMVVRESMRKKLVYHGYLLQPLRLLIIMDVYLSPYIHVQLGENHQSYISKKYVLKKASILGFHQLNQILDKLPNHHSIFPFRGLCLITFV